MEKLFELTFQDQTLNPQVGTFTDASQTTGTFTLEDGEYYLTNGDTKGFYAYKPVAMQSGLVDDSKVIIEFDLKVVTASVNTHAIIGTYAGVDGNGIPTGAKITLQYNAGDIELALGSGTTETLIESADVVVDQWYHFRIDCYLTAAIESTYEVKIDDTAVTTVTGATTDYELGVISVLGTDLHACDECGIKNITLVTETNLYVGRTALDQVLQDVKGYVDSHNGVLTIQKNGTDIGTFSANQATDATANIEVPTKTSDLTNDSGFITSDNTKIPLAGSNAISGSLIPATDNSIDIGSSTSNIKMLYTKGITINGAQFSPSDVLPTGCYIQFAGSQAPEGFLVCNGGAISRTTYSRLFAVIGTIYGSGDGSTTFNLPNLTDRFLQGSTTSGTVKDAGLPNITGYVTHSVFKVAVGSEGGIGAFRNESYSDNVGYELSAPASVINYHRGDDFDASRSSSIYGNSTTVQPPALTCLICIKY